MITDDQATLMFAPVGEVATLADAGLAVGVATTTASEPSTSGPAEPIAAIQPRQLGQLGNNKLVGFMLAHEQFAAPRLADHGEAASRAGFSLLATSDHFQPWQANEAHCGEAWVTLGALGARIAPAWMGTTVTCPTLRYHPAVVAEAFATLALFNPGRVFLGVGSGEALNEQAATGQWPSWRERWDRLIEAIAVIRALWSGKPVSHHGAHYQVEGRMTDPPPEPIPLLMAANGKKAMRLAGEHGDGLITDPLTWHQFGAEWRDGAIQAGKNPDQMPVLVEQFVVVGDRDDATEAAGLWRFLPKAFKPYYNIPDPAEIERHADAEVPIDKVIEGWPIGTDPAIHIDAINKLFDSGVTIVNVHSGQPDQRKVIDFYGDLVLPKLML